MQTQQTSSTGSSAHPLTLPRLVALLLVTMAATAGVVYFALRTRGNANESVVSVMDTRESASQKINTLAVLDATGRTTLQPEIGRRYRVRMETESRDSAACVTHIGGMVTFVNGVKPGEVVVVEVTRLKRTTAEAVVVKDTRTVGDLLVPSAAAAETDTPASTVAPVSAPVSAVYTGTVAFVGKFGDGLVRMEGHNIFIPGVQTGDRIAFEVTERGDRSWKGRLVAKLSAGGSEAGAVSGAGAGAGSGSAMGGAGANTGGRDLSAAEHVQPGKEYDVTITDKERTKPDQDGMVRIDGLVVIVPGTQPGDKVKVRITERRPRLANAIVVERLTTTPAP